jgi:NAD(P)-dependent dehydrogenase (short-subunit alcohol dehydrogenase family)
MKLAGRVAIIAGGGSGIGRASRPRHAMKRFGRAEEVAAAALYLAATRRLSRPAWCCRSTADGSLHE